jgi:hypothetical protein
MGDNLFESSFIVVTCRLEKLVNVSFGPSFVELEMVFFYKLHELIDFMYFLIQIIKASFINESFDFVFDNDFVIVLFSGG